MHRAAGKALVPGIQLGNVWIGVQPALGVEGDPMRLLFERDLTPHPQYAAFYKWLQQDFQADAVLHFGMHGTVEWLPGAPLGEWFGLAVLHTRSCNSIMFAFQCTTR